MKTYTAIIQKQENGLTEVAEAKFNSLSEAKAGFSKLGKLICYSFGSKVYFN